MWNWREFYQLVDQVKKYARVLYSGESLMQIPQEESMGGPFLLHTISGIYCGSGAESSFCGYRADQVLSGRLVWLYLKRNLENGHVMFNAVFLQYGGKKQGVQFRAKHGIRMVYRKMAEEPVVGHAGSKRKSAERTEFFSADVKFRKLVVIGRSETEFRKTTIAELLDIFGRAADEQGILLLAEQNVRMLCHGIGEKGQMRENVATEMV